MCRLCHLNHPRNSVLSAATVLGLSIGGALLGFALIAAGLYYFCRLRAAEVYAARAKLGGIGREPDSASVGGDSMLATELQHRGAGSSSNTGHVGVGIDDGTHMANHDSV